MTVGIGENQNAGNNKGNTQNLPHVETHVVFKINLIFFQEFVYKTQAPQNNQKPSEDATGRCIFFLISPKPKQKHKEQYAGKGFVQLGRVPGNTECPDPRPVRTVFFLCYFIPQRFTDRLVHKFRQAVEIELHIADQKLANLIFLCAVFEKEIQVKRNAAVGTRWKGRILLDLHGLRDIVGGFVVKNCFCDFADKHHTDRRIGRFTDNFRIEEITQPDECPGKGYQNDNTVQYLKVILTRFFLSAVQPKGKENSKGSPMACQSLQSREAEFWFKLKRQQDPQGVGQKHVGLVKNNVTQT